MKNKLLISTALAAAFTVANAYAVEPAQSAVSDVKNWNDNIYELEENTSRGGGVLRPAADEKDLTAGKIGGNRITARQTSGHSGEVYAQGAVLWLGKKLSSVNAGEISNNGLNVTTENNNNAKATANGGAFAIYKGGYIDNLTANFTGNKASSRYTGEGEYNGTGSSAGGGAIHVEGQYGTDEKTGIREINGNFTGNGAEGAAYANGGAIYFKAGADRDGQTGTGLVTTTINGNFADNFVKAITANAAAKASTGGAISVKRKDGKTVDLTLNGSFTNNRVETNATEALGGALYSEGMITLGNNTVFSGNSATSTTGKAFGGAIYNTADATLKISNAVFSGNKANGRLNDIHNLGALNVSGNLTLDGGISGNGTTTFARGSQLTVKTGTTTISNRVINNGATLNLTFDNGFSGRYELITDGGSLDREFSIAGNNLYNITGIENGIYNVNKKSAAEVSTATGATGNQAAALTALTAGKADNAVFNAVADAVSAMAQSTDRTQVKAALDAVTALAPEVSPMVQHTQSQTANQIFGAVGTRFAGGTIAAAEGTSSGDSVFERAAVWIQGLFNKSKRHDTARTEGFDADSSGVAVGAEKFVTDNFKIGLGYAYANTDIDGFMRSTDVDTHSAILYGEYKPSQWYVNGIATYGWSDYSEGKNVAGIGIDADYDVETFGLQAMTGYELQSESFVFVPETGLRYVHISQDAYKDSADQRVSANDSDLLTGVLGARINRSWEFENGISLKPEARFALTYDLVNDAGGSVVTLANGSAYAVDGEALDRFGMELGVGVTAEVDDNIEVSLGYEGKFREKYHDHTGLLNAKYKF